MYSQPEDPCDAVAKLREAVNKVIKANREIKEAHQRGDIMATLAALDSGWKWHDTLEEILTMSPPVSQTHIYELMGEHRRAEEAFRESRQMLQAMNEYNASVLHEIRTSNDPQATYERLRSRFFVSEDFAAGRSARHAPPARCPPQRSSGARTTAEGYEREPPFDGAGSREDSHRRFFSRVRYMEGDRRDRKWPHGLAKQSPLAWALAWALQDGRRRRRPNSPPPAVGRDSLGADWPRFWALCDPGDGTIEQHRQWLAEHFRKAFSHYYAMGISARLAPQHVNLARRELCAATALHARMQRDMEEARGLCRRHGVELMCRKDTGRIDNKGGDNDDDEDDDGEEGRKVPRKRDLERLALCIELHEELFRRDLDEMSKYGYRCVDVGTCTWSKESEERDNADSLRSMPRRLAENLEITNVFWRLPETERKVEQIEESRGTLPIDLERWMAENEEGSAGPGVWRELWRELVGSGSGTRGDSELGETYKDRLEDMRR